MRKFLPLREWVDLPKAAKYLSDFLEDQLSPADVMRLGLERKLVLSVRFVNKAQAWRMRIVPLADAQRVPGIPVEGHPPYQVILAVAINDREGVEIEPGTGTTQLDGVYDLPMLGGEILEIERLCQQADGGPEVTLTSLEGAYVRDPTGRLFQLCEPLETVPHPDEPDPDGPIQYPIGFPHGAVVVVRTKELLSFIDSLSPADSPQDKPLGTRERNNLLLIVAGLCLLAKVGHRGSAKVIAGAVGDLGIDESVSDDTVLKLLHQIEAEFGIKPGTKKKPN